MAFPGLSQGLPAMVKSGLRPGFNRFADAGFRFPVDWRQVFAVNHW